MLNIDKELTNCVLFPIEMVINLIWIKRKETTRACMKCVHFGVSQNFKTQFVRTRHVPDVTTSHPSGHCLLVADLYFCKVVAVIFIVIARCLDPTYPSFQPQTPAKSAV